jgi:predicted 2-oxoglutarate/Fe(II)-dependent dioxygenase YbiX
MWVNVLVSTTLQKDDVEGGDLFFPNTTLQKDDVEGGDLFFPNHSYMIPTKDNQTIIFPGWVKHGVTSVMSNDRYAITKFIHSTVPE